MSNTKKDQNIFLTVIAVFLTVAAFTGCRHDEYNSKGSPFQIGLLNYNPNGFLPFFPFFNYSVKKGAYEREQESAAGF